MAGFAIARFGLLTAVTIWVTYFGLAYIPLPLSYSYAVWSLIVAGLFVALAAYAFRVSIGPRALFADALEG